MSRLGRSLAAALSVGTAVAATPALLRIVWSWPHRVAVEGHSMEPTLEAGDWLLVDPDVYRATQPRLGDLVVARDPRDVGRLLVKRVADVRPDGFLLTGDHPAHVTDALEIGLVSSAQLVGRPWLRYWPPRRVGPVR